MGSRFSVYVAASTEVGGRETNEDSYLALWGEKAPCQTLGLLAVADGMGGSGNGRTASALAVETLADTFAAACEVSQGKPVASTRDLLRFAVQKANAAVYQAAQRSSENRGMGSTCAAVAITEDTLHIAHVGDSRIYLFRDGKLHRLVEDQWVRQGRGSGERDELSGRRGGVTLVDKAVGWQPVLTPEVDSVPVQEGDLIIVCSDGLTDEMSEMEIEEALRDPSPLPEICGRLAQTASSADDCDNVTVVMAKLLKSDPS